ncbi:MAG: DUF1365 family protein [Pseudomonadota bacterium]
MQKTTPAAPLTSALYRGVVAHRRLKPVGHALKYNVFSMLIDLDELPELDRRLKRFSRGRFNLFSFHDRDCGPKPWAADGPVTDVAGYMRRLLADHGVDASGGIRLLCYPRILGYVFNPLAVYFIYGAGGTLSALMYEVSSTFGERHSYLIPVTDRSDTIRQSASKKLHVSPFMAMDQTYAFWVRPPSDDIVVAIRQSDAEGPILNASFVGERTPLSDKELLKAFVDYPLMTVKVIAAIHWEAAKLMWKGMRLQAGTPAPSYPVTLVKPNKAES